MDESWQPLTADAPVDYAPDRRFDAIAALTSRLLGTPAALVSFLDRAQPVPSAVVGVPGPGPQPGVVPLTYSFCQYVVSSGAPLVLSDVREIDGRADDPATGQPGVVAYAGFPLTDAHGRPIGSLCVVDHQPREWTEQECAALAELAAFCSSEREPRTTGLRQALVADRDRMAEELQRGVSSDLQALTTLLEGVRSLATVESAAMIDDAIDAVDQITARLRAAVLHAAER